jgi:uncharacterized protein
LLVTVKKDISAMNLENAHQNKTSLPEVLREVVRRIVLAVQPERIILFGSSARGDAKADSDIDVLVVKPCAQRREVAGKIYRALIGVGRAVDVVVATPDDLERYRNSPSMVIAPAINEGREIYAA